MHSAFRSVAVALGCLMLAGQSAARQSPVPAAPPADGGTVQQQMDDMRREMERVLRDNAAMRGEIDQLRAEADDQWLTEKRSNEIKTLVNDVLADADTRASLLQSGMTAGWNEHFFLSSGDGRFLLMLEGLEQIRFIWNHHDEPDRWRYGFENARTQLTFRGHVFNDDIEYLVRGEFARSGGNETLLDAWARYRFTDKVSLRFGQFKLPYSREFLVSEGQQLAVERTMVSDFLSAKRSQGIELEYLDSVNRWSGAFSDTTGGTLGGASTNTVWSAQDTEWSVTSRYERLIAGSWEQFSDFTSPRGDEFGLLLGLGAFGQQGESTGSFTTTRDENRVFGATVDISAEWGGANLFASAYYVYFDSDLAGVGIVDFLGLTAQGGWYLDPKWEVFGRIEYLASQSNEFETPNLLVGTVGVNYYIDGHDVKWTTDVSVGFNEISGTYASDIAGFRGDTTGNPQFVFRTQFQLMF